MNVAVYGGSFNPVHVVHVMNATLALMMGMDMVLVVPAHKHPFAKDLAPFEDRVMMCELGFAPLRSVEVSRLEQELGGESRTLRLLTRLHDDHPDWSMRLLIGSDILAEVEKWHRFDLISEIAPPLVVGRNGRGHGPGSLAMPDVSSTDVRSAFARDDNDYLSSRVPAAVLRHARNRGLYRV